MQRGDHDLARAVGPRVHAITTADRPVVDFLHLLGRHPVPVSVVDDGRLLGVVPRAAVLDALSAVPVRGGARDPHVPIGQWVADAIDWLLATMPWLFDAISEVMLRLVNRLTDVLASPAPVAGW